jgi:hypothetical protein
MEIMRPTATPRATARSAASGLESLSGLTIGIISNGWRAMDAMSPRLAGRLKERFGVKAVPFYSAPLNRPIPEDVLAKVAAECDGAIVGLAN